MDDEFDPSEGFFWHPVSRVKRRNTKSKRIAAFFINERYTCVPATFNVGVEQQNGGLDKEITSLLKFSILYNR